MLDNKDREILAELDKDSRQSNKKIAGKIKLRKDTVNYRIKRLIKENIITRFISETDSSKLGYIAYKIYLQFQNINEDIEKKIWEYLKKHPHAVWIVKCTGRWDAIFAFLAKDLMEFNKAQIDFLNKFSRYIQNKQIVININYNLYNRKWLTNSKIPKVDEFGKNLELIKLDKKDEIILGEITNNSRIPLIELAGKTHLSSPQVLYRIKTLKNKGILVSNTIDLNLKKLNYQFCKVLLYLKNISIKRKKEFVEFCANQKNITALSEVIAPWDIELEFEIENFNKLMCVMEDVRKQFPDLIRNFESIIITEESGRMNIPKI